MNKKHLECSGFSECANEIIKARSLSRAEVIKNSGIDRSYGYQILSGRRKPGRDKIIRLCFGLQLSSVEADQLLESAKFSRLLVHDNIDAIALMCLDNGASILEFDKKVMEHQSS